MQIRDVKCYLLQGEPATRQESCGARGSIAPVPPGISGLLTHDQGFGAVDPEGFTFTGEEPGADVPPDDPARDGWET